MKIMRIFVLITLCAVLLVGCGTTHYDENVWYSEEKLSQCFLPSMPVIEKSLLRKDDQTIYTSLTVSEFEDYAKLVYSYLQAQNFKYLGTRGHLKSSLAGLFFTSYYFQPAETLKQHYQDGAYYFIYSDGETDANGKIIFCCLLLQNSYGSGYSLDHNGGKFYYNTVISLRKDENATGDHYFYDPEHIDPCFFGHLYDRGTDYPIPGTEQTVNIRNCVHCGHEDYEPFTGDMHSYRITVTKGSQYIITLPETHATDGTLPEKRPSGMLMKLYTQRLDDADIVFTVNGTVIPKEETEKGWCYSFIIPNCDVEIAINVIDGYLISE